MMIEQNTNYAYKLKYMDNPTFDKVRDLSTKFYRELPQALQDELFEALNRGIDILDSEPQMTAYLFAFGKMHQAKLNYAFGKLPEEFLEQPEINIIDYGCGQALGTMCYADFLRDNGYTQKIKTITLIEPSEICLKRAALHASVFFTDAEIKTVNKKFDDLTQDDIYYDIIGPTLHILSNVLDMLSFDLDRLAELLKGCWKDYYELGCAGYDQFVCVGPFFNYSDKDKRMDDFISRLDGIEDFRETFDKYEFDPEKAWTAQILCFSIGELEEIELPTEVTEDDMNEGIKDDWGVVYSKDGRRLLKCTNELIVEYSIKKGTKVICDNAFEKCSILKHITIPNTVSIIGKYAFCDCESLLHITIPDSVETIDEGAFLDCESLIQMIVPDSVTTIATASFQGCSSLQQIIISNSVTCIEDDTFHFCSSLQQIIIPNSVKWINARAFLECSSLQQVVFSNSVTVIGHAAFAECKSLQQITIPNSVTTIEAYAFMGCYSLQQIIIPNSVLTIGNGAFSDCWSLHSINIPDSVKSIGINPFRNCHKMSIKSNSSRYNFQNGLLIDKQESKIVSYTGDDDRINIPDSITVIGKEAFYGSSSLRHIFIPDSVKSIEENAFENCTSLLQIEIPNSVSTIRCGSFIYCKSLQQVIIPKSIKAIGAYAFQACSSLRQITIPNSITTIGTLAFGWCSSMKQFIIPDSINNMGDNPFCGCYALSLESNSTRFIIQNGLLLDNQENKLISYIGNDISVVIPNSLTTISAYAFGVRLPMQQITIPGTVTSIGKYAFTENSSLRQIFIPKGSKEKFKKMLYKSLWTLLVEQ